ncbi:C40 family peptidase [Angustibacter sp. McL0619]|uniref:C40 family peptidase n=1 Tax=Angustibacter sp. McL0619 TaxID=3415676 RepID=UPI003CF4DF3C
MTTNNTGRHRVQTRSASPVLAAVQATGPGAVVAKTGAVLAVSGGLVASLGLQAHAATPSAAEASSSTVDPSARVQQASAVPAAFVDGVAKAPSFGDIGFTAKAKPKPKPKPVKARVLKLRETTRVSRSEVRTAVAPVSIKAGDPGSAEFGAAVMSIAARYAGTPYQYGGTTPAGFDCSGYTRYVFAQVGIDLPRTSDGQRAAAARISRSEAVPGDLVFLPGHVGIYAGNGMMWDSPRTGESVSKRAIYSSSASFGRVG